MLRPVISVVLALATLAFAGCSDGPERFNSTTPERRDVASYLTTNGRLQALNQTAVHAEAAGRVELRMEKGATVRAGEVLVVLADSGPSSTQSRAQAKLDAARAELASLERGPTPAERAELSSEIETARSELARLDIEVARLGRLIEKQAASQSELDKLQADAVRWRHDIDTLEARLAGPVPKEQRKVLAALVREAEAALGEADQRVAALHVRAPSAGTVYSLAVADGDFVQPGDLIARVGTIEKIRVVVYIDEPELGRVALGSKATITADAYPNTSWPCTIDRLATEIVELETRRVGEVSCSVENTDLRLIPNLTVNVRIAAGEASNALSVPREAVGRDGGEPFVWIADDGEARRKYVELGVQGAAFVEITAGLDGSEAVLLPGTSTLSEGQPVSLLGEAGNE